MHAPTLRPSAMATELAGLTWTSADGVAISEALVDRDVLALSVDLPSHGSIEVRTLADDSWTSWRPLGAASEHAPDPGSAEATGFRSHASELEWLGDVDGVQLRTTGDPTEVAVHLTTSAGGAQALTYQPGVHDVGDGVATAAAWPPAMVARTSWDPAGECVPRERPELSDRIDRIAVHHTAIFPQYAAEEADDIVRAICINHVQRRGFDDVGYNFLIDAYGVIYQGRAGGVFQPVVGAHASGFNVGAVGIALIGNHQTGDVTQAATDALDTLIAWLADHYGLDPFATHVAVSTGGATTRFPAGTPVELPTIVGHRDTGDGTACPGDFLYERVRGVLPIAPRVAARMQHPPVPAPPAEPSTPAPLGGPDATEVTAVSVLPPDGTVEWLVRGLVGRGRIFDAVRAATTTLASR